ncbi:MAG: DNA-binding protein [Synergistaceae bacterium]|nr:DNA-binding protein [Synergistaceae bacterium]
MVLDDGARLEQRVYVNGLYDLYAPLLTKRQRDIYEIRYFSDLSLAEAASALCISRQAVHILVNRTVNRLLTLEKDLGFAARLRDMQERISELEARRGSELRMKSVGALC